MKKICCRCKIEKDIDNFSPYIRKNRKNNPYYCSHCKQCNKYIVKEWKLKNPTRLKELKKKYYLKHRDKILIKNKIWRKNNKEKVRNCIEKWRSNNRERVRARNRISAKRNAQTRREYERYKTASNVHFRIKLSLKARIRNALKGKNKSQSTINLLGCSIKDLKNYLESKFNQSMNWNNYGKIWHIDHIRPCASFDLTKPEEQAKCFHYTNLQPLLVFENLSKGAKYNN